MVQNPIFPTISTSPITCPTNISLLPCCNVRDCKHFKNWLGIQRRPLTTWLFGVPVALPVFNRTKSSMSAESAGSIIVGSNKSRQKGITGVIWELCPCGFLDLHLGDRFGMK